MSNSMRPWEFQRYIQRHTTPASRGEGSGARDIFRERIEQTSAENQERIARRDATLARKLEELRNTPLEKPNTSEEPESEEI